MTDSPRKWTDLPATAQVDAALRRAAAGIAGWKDPGIECEPFLHDWNRDDLARVFAASFGRMVRFSDGTGGFNVMSGNLDPLWFLALTDPRAALCALLDLLQVEIPNE